MTTSDEDAAEFLRHQDEYHQIALQKRRREGEDLAAYLFRLSGRGRLKRGGANVTKYDRIQRTTFAQLGRWAADFDLLLRVLRARSMTKNYRYCCCVDIKRLQSFKRSLNLSLSLADILSSAEGGNRCLRCWFIAQCVMSFADRWSGVPNTDISVRTNAKIGSIPYQDPNCTIMLFWVHWKQPDVTQSGGGSANQSKLAIQIFHEQGGYALYPFLTPRRITPAVSDAQNSSAITKAWIEDCISNHDLCNRNTDNLFLPTRLIDIGLTDEDDHIRLVNSAHISRCDVKFAALSHCWGEAIHRTKSIPKTYKSTLQARLSRIELDEMSLVFKDAIGVARALGLRYLWIDSLCIIQDDADDFACEAGQMGSIYGEAYIVLAATRAPTSDWGLFHHRPEPQAVSHSNQDGTMSTVLVREQMRHEEFLTEEPTTFESTPLFARAWCFQERLLARRVVHFAENELVFECREQMTCECTWPRPVSGVLRTFKSVVAYALTKVSAQRRYEVWYYALRIYTTRSLTYEKDRLPAISGFARQLAIPEMGPYYAGMWSNQLPSSLLWQVQRHRPGNNNTIKRPSPCRSPTWSWASVEGVVQGFLSFHWGIVDTATVIHVEQELLTSDPFGPVQQASIVLEAPAIETRIQTRADDGDVQSRTYLISRAAEPTDELSFEADVAVDVPPVTLCLAIQHDIKGVHEGRWSCLVFRKDEQNPHYYRMGRFDAPSHWFANAERAIVEIR